MGDKIRFYNKEGNELDVRDEDISMGLDLLKNEIHRWMKEGGPDAKSARDSLFRLEMFLRAIRIGLKPESSRTDN